MPTNCKGPEILVPEMKAYSQENSLARIIIHSQFSRIFSYKFSQTDILIPRTQSIITFFLLELLP